MKIEKHFVLEMCELDENDEAGLERLNDLVELSSKLFTLYGGMGDELGDFAREADCCAIECNAFNGEDEVDTYAHLVLRNTVVLRYLNAWRLTLFDKVPEGWASDVVAAAGGAAKLYDDAINWCGAHTRHNPNLARHMELLDELQTHHETRPRPSKPLPKPLPKPRQHGKMAEAASALLSLHRFHLH